MAEAVARRSLGRALPAAVSTRMALRSGRASGFASEDKTFVN
jgi:hypothetical protein